MLQRSVNWERARRWMFAESNRIGWLATATEDLEAKTINGELHRIKEWTTDENGGQKCVFYVEPVYKFRISDVDGYKCPSTFVQRHGQWLCVYNEYIIHTEKVYPLWKVLECTNRFDLEAYVFNPKKKNPMMFDFWIQFLEMEAREIAGNPEHLARLAEANRLITLHK